MKRWGKDLASRGLPGSQLQPRAGQLGAAQTPEGPWAPASPPRGRDGCLAGAPLAWRLVPALDPHAAAFLGREGALGPARELGFGPRPRPPTSPTPTRRPLPGGRPERPPPHQQETAA